MITTTLSREIIKWIQGLDLSYSVRDVRRDLNDGFLVAEILSRYYPTGISMHSFDHSQNTDKKKNNWNLLEKFFKLQGIGLGRKDFEKIVTDNDLPTLIDFMTKLYQHLTNKKINKGPLEAIQAFNREQNKQADELTHSFVLKEKGLEKLKDEDKDFNRTEKTHDADRDDKQKKEEKNTEEQTITNTNTSNKLKNYFKAQSKPISSQVADVNQYNIHVKGVSTRPVASSISKVRPKQDLNFSSMTASKQHLDHAQPSDPTTPQHNMMKQNNTHDSSKFQSLKRNDLKTQLERTVYDVLLEVTLNRFNFMAHPYDSELKRLDFKSYPEQLNTFPDEFNEIIFREIFDRLNVFSDFLAKDQNEIWKFLNFILGCLKNIHVLKDYFKIVIDITKLLGERLILKDSVKNPKVFQDFFLENIAEQVIKAEFFEKKEQIIKILYYFTPPEDKRFVIMSFKSALKNQAVFMQSLVVLLSMETDINKDPELLDVFLTSAKAGMQSAQPVIKTMSLAILASLTKLNHEMILHFIQNKLDILSAEQSWENQCQIIIICTRIIKGIISSDQYQNLVKKASPQFSKNYNLENELLANKLKGDIEGFAEAIVRMVQNKPNNHVLRTFIVYCSDIAQEVRLIMDQIANIVVHSDEILRSWFFNSTETNTEEFIISNNKSLRYKTSFNSEDLRRSAKELLISVVDNISRDPPETFDLAYLETIEFGMRYTDFKSLNSEVLQSITNIVIGDIFTTMCDENLNKLSIQIITMFMTYMISGDIKIKEIDNLFAQAINFLYSNELYSCVDNVKNLLGWYKREIDLRKVEREKIVLRDICRAVTVRNLNEPFIDDIKQFVGALVDHIELDDKQ